MLDNFQRPRVTVRTIPNIFGATVLPRTGPPSALEQKVENMERNLTYMYKYVATGLSTKDEMKNITSRLTTIGGNINARGSTNYITGYICPGRR